MTPAEAFAHYEALYQTARAFREHVESTGDGDLDAAQAQEDAAELLRDRAQNAILDQNGSLVAGLVDDFAQAQAAAAAALAGLKSNVEVVGAVSGALTTALNAGGAAVPQS